jgi:hypothetical protein
VGPPYCTIRLRVIHRCEGNLCSDMLAKVFEHCAVKELYVVDGDMSGDAIAADDVLPEDFFYCCRAYIVERLRSDPLHEIFDRHDGERVVALPGGNLLTISIPDRWRAHDWAISCNGCAELLTCERTFDMLRTWRQVLLCHLSLLASRILT